MINCFECKKCIISECDKCRNKRGKCIKSGKKFEEKEQFIGKCELFEKMI